MKFANSKSFSWPNGRRAAVSLTWDDARPSQVDVGVPILNQYGTKGTFFVLPRNMKHRTEQWRAAAASGHEIGNHTLNHPCTGNFNWQTPETMLENYTLRRMEKELLRANELLHSELGVTPTSFAFCCAQTFVGRGKTLKSYIPLVAKLFEVGRIGFSETYARPDRLDLAQVCSLTFDNQSFEQIKKVLDAAVSEGCWLVLTGHEIGKPGIRQTTSAATLRRLCAYFNSQPDIWVDTVTAVGRHVGATVKHPPIPARLR